MKYFILVLVVFFIFSGCATTAGIIIGLNCKKSVEIQSIEPDTHIEITFRNLNTIKGSFKKVEDKHLYLNFKGEEKAISIMDIHYIEVPDLTWRWISIGTGYIIDSVLFYYFVIRPSEELGKSK
jgi:hypothetical protein